MNNAEDTEFIQESRSYTAIASDWIDDHMGWIVSGFMLFAFIQLLLNAAIALHLYVFELNPPVAGGIPKTDIATLAINAVVWVVVLAALARYDLKRRFE